MLPKVSCEKSLSKQTNFYFYNPKYRKKNDKECPQSTSSYDRHRAVYGNGSPEQKNKGKRGDFKTKFQSIPTSQ